MEQLPNPGNEMIHATHCTTSSDCFPQPRPTAGLIGQLSSCTQCVELSRPEDDP
jgi:hypothetical protein